MIVGLGNPGREYTRTRHNVGFELIDALASAHGIKVEQRVARALVGRGAIGGETVLLVKPQTFYNNAGEAVAALLRREQVPLENLLIAMDDLHLPVGRLRLRARGSSGGNNGLKSIATQLATQEFARIRLGIGEPPPGLQVDWVLSRFSAADRKLIDEMLILASGAAEIWLREGIEAAMNRFNSLDAGVHLP